MAPSWWSKETVAVVTGANRGIGLEIVRQLAAQGLTVILTARDTAKGQASADGLHAEGLKSVIFHQLDAVDPKSVQDLAVWLKAEYGGIDILVNNAAITARHSNGVIQTGDYDYETAKSLLDTNYYGVKSITTALVPLMKPSPHGSRIVNFTTRMALYERLRSESLLKTFRDEEKYSEEVSDSLATAFLDAMKAGRAEKDGWIGNAPDKNPIYSESKMILNVYSVSLAKSLAKTQPEGNSIFLASTCPGLTRTAVFEAALQAGFNPPEGFPIKTPAEGAATAVWLALLPETEWQGKVGKFFGENTEYLFGWENPPIAG